MKLNRIDLSHFRNGRLKKYFLIMRLTSLLTLFLTLQMSASVWSQTMSVKLKNSTLQELFVQIKKNSNYRFFYNNDEVDVNQRISIDAEQKTVGKILSAALEGTPYSFKEMDNKLILIEKTDNQTKSLGTGFQQQKSVSGKVTDSSGAPLPGVSVVVKGTTTGTITDVDGKFSLTKIPENAPLQFSFVGMKTQEVPVGGKNNINVVLEEESIGLGEVIAVGYGSQIKEAVTGSIQQIKTDELKDIPVSQFTQQLQGKLSGVQISQTTGKPGQELSVRVRGQASISGGNTPLYVVDGFPIVGGLSSINPNEIESISILKDASSTSLYGSRAANGVVLITTKKGKTGQTSVNVSSYVGVQSVPQKGRPDMMNAREFAQFRKEIAIENGQTVDPAYQNPEQYGNGTDWYDILLRNATVQDHNITLSSRNDKMGVTAVAGLFNQQGVLFNTDFSRYSLRINTDFKMNDYVKIGLNVAPNFVSDSNLNTDGTLWGGSILQSSILTTPLAPYKNADGTIPLTATGSGLFPNPNWYNVINQFDAHGERFELLSNAFVEITPIKGLTLKSTINYDLGREMSSNYSSSQVGSIFAPPPSVPRASQSHRNFGSWLAEHTATYLKSINKHNFEVLLGFSAQEWKEQGLNSSATGYADDLIQSFSAAPANKKSTSNYKNEWSLVSYISRLNYNYDNKYFISAAIRRDGSSRFGFDNQYGNFPSVSLGWILTKENFMSKIEAINLVKLRASIGTIGNNNIGNYAQRGLVSTSNAVFNDNIVSGRTVSGIGNTMLNWEQTRESDFGLDLGLLKNRISFSYDYYKKNTSQLLFSVPIPQASGFSSILTNLGELEFWGHEFVVGARVLDGTFKLDVDLNYSYNDNKVISLATPTGKLTDGRHITQVGERIGQFYGLVHEGVYKNKAEFDASPKYDVATVGSAKYKDVSGDGKITQAEDRAVLGNSAPTSLFGFTIKMEYKNFDLSIVGTGAAGYYIVDGAESYTGNLDGVFNVTRDVIHRWKSESDPGDGKYGNTLSGSTYTERDWFNSKFLQNSNHLIIKNITLGYNVPINKNFIRNARIYTSVQQAFVFTKYKGANPEVGAGGNPLYAGVDDTSYPVPRTISLGINLNF